MRAIRRERVMSMRATPPILVCVFRQKPFSDFLTLFEAEISHCDGLINDFKCIGTDACRSTSGRFLSCVSGVASFRCRSISQDLPLSTASCVSCRVFLKRPLYGAKADAVLSAQLHSVSERVRLEELRRQRDLAESQARTQRCA
jgi:hypothetical protein